MANKKITDIDTITSINDTDKIVVTETDTSVKRISYANLMKSVNDKIDSNTSQVNDCTNNLSQLSNSSFLINGDFKKPINQRGKNKYVESGKYTIDRWIFLSDNTDTSTQNFLQLNNQYISIYGYANSKHAQFQQLVEHPEFYMNQNVSVSVKYRISNGQNKNNFRIYGRITSSQNNKWLYNDQLIPDGQWHVYTKTFKVEYIDSLTSFIPVWISCINFDFETQSIVSNLDENCQIDIEYAKAEIGDISTPFIPRLYSEELALCKRYYQKVTAVILQATFNDMREMALQGEMIEMRIAPTILNVCGVNGENESMWTIQKVGVGDIGLDKTKSKFVLFNDSLLYCVLKDGNNNPVGSNDTDLYTAYLKLDAEIR